MGRSSHLTHLQDTTPAAPPAERASANIAESAVHQGTLKANDMKERSRA